MINIFLFFAVFAFSSFSLASESYIAQDDLQQALEARFGIGAGFGVKNDSCILCHRTSAGGFGNINPSFGVDFKDTADVIFGSGDQLSVGQLEQVLDDSALKDVDSDGDGDSNEQEFLADSDPASDISAETENGRHQSGGCGLIVPRNSKTGGMPPTASFIFLPLIALLTFRRENVKKSVAKATP